jgi:tetratricopeptide (TPR) repeat protein
MTLKNQAIQTALQGNWQDAIVMNKSLIAENPEDIDALNRLALAYTITGKVKEAKSTYQKVVRIDPLNPIALRNLKKIREKKISLTARSTNPCISNKFLEEPGKTKVVELVNIAQPKIVEALRTGQMLELSIKRLKIFASEGKQYIGVLPDDIARRLIKFIKGSCKYEAYVKSATQHKVTIFIKEVKKSTRYKDQPSFTSITDSPLVLEKNEKLRTHLGQQEEKEEEEETHTYSEEE